MILAAIIGIAIFMIWMDQWRTSGQIVHEIKEMIDDVK